MICDRPSTVILVLGFDLVKNFCIVSDVKHQMEHHGIPYEKLIKAPEVAESSRLI